MSEMNARRPVVVTIAAILLIVLTLFVAGFGIARQYGLLNVGLGNRQFLPGQFQGRNFNPQGGFPPGGLPNDQNIPGRGAADIRMYQEIWHYSGKCIY